MLAVYGALDARVNGTRDAAVAALQAAGLTYEVKEYADANHAFFNDTGANYNATAATRGVRGRARLVRPLPRVARARARAYACP